MQRPFWALHWQTLVHLTNPRIPVFGGQLGKLDDIILATVREVIDRAAPPLATRKLIITTSGVPDPGVLGLFALVADHVLAADSIDRALQGSGLVENSVEV